MTHHPEIKQAIIHILLGKGLNKLIVLTGFSAYPPIDVPVISIKCVSCTFTVWHIDLCQCEMFYLTNYIIFIQERKLNFS